MELVDGQVGDVDHKRSQVQQPREEVEAKEQVQRASGHKRRGGAPIPVPFLHGGEGGGRAGTSGRSGGAAGRHFFGLREGGSEGREGAKGGKHEYNGGSTGRPRVFKVGSFVCYEGIGLK